MKSGLSVISLSFLFVFSGCSGEMMETGGGISASFEQMDYGSDFCVFSDEPIETVRYGGRMEMAGGEVYNFMSIECLAGFYLELNDNAEIHSVRVVDFTHGKRLLDVGDVVFLHSRLRPSPNGMFLTAIEAEDEKMITNIYDAYPGSLLNWEEVLELVRNEWDLTGISALESEI